MYDKKFITIFLLGSLVAQITLAAPRANLIKDIRQGAESSTPNLLHRGSILPIPVDINGTLFFNANDGVHGEELWQTDGTPAGTKIFVDFVPGSNGSKPHHITSIGNDLFLTIKTNDPYSREEQNDLEGHGYSEDFIESLTQDLKYYELRKVNSVTGETIVLKKSKGVLTSRSHARPIIGSPFNSLGNVNGTLLFTDRSEEKSRWKSDGTVAGTQPVESEIIPTSYRSSWTLLDNKLIFKARDGDSDDEKLWQSNEVDAEVVKINGDFDSINSKLIKINSALFFIANKGDDLGLWKYDGSESGATLIYNFPQNDTERSSLTELINVNGKLFFLERFGGFPSPIILWQSDGTEAGTVSLKAFRFEDFPKNFININGLLFFTKKNEDHSGIELWKSDGTVTGTIKVKDVQDPSVFGRSTLFNINNSLFIINENEVWRSNGTEEGTTIVPDALPETISFSLQYTGHLNTDTSLFFFASDGVHGAELWIFKDEKLAETVPPLCEAGLDPQTIKKGGGTALWWWSQNATAGSIDNSIGEINVPSDYKWIYPTETTTYTMTAKGTNGTTSTCEATVVVEAESLPPICEMGADPQVITAGEGTALWWWSQNVSSATINNEKWSVSVPSDYAWFYPSETATYTMTAIGDDGSTVSCNTTITVK